jgi:hypothetical protein
MNAAGFSPAVHDFNATARDSSRQVLQCRDANEGAAGSSLHVT